MTLDAVLAIYDRLIDTHDGVARKGKTTAYTSMNGNMFSFVGPDAEMCLRLSEADITAFGAGHSADPVIRHNSVMKGYVAVSDELLANDAELASWFAKSVAHAGTLKPKPTRKPKAK